MSHLRQMIDVFYSAEIALHGQSEFRLEMWLVINLQTLI